MTLGNETAATGRSNVWEDQHEQIEALVDDANASFSDTDFSVEWALTSFDEPTAEEEEHARAVTPQR